MPSFVTNWVTKLVVVAVVVFVLAINIVGVVVARVGGKSDAQNAAYAAAQNWHSTGLSTLGTQTRLVDAYNSAVAAVPHRDRIPQADFQIASDGTVTLTVLRPARVFGMEKIGFLKKYIVSKETATGDFQP